MAVADAILATERRLRLPRWLLAMFEGGQGNEGYHGMAGACWDPAALLRLYCRHGRLQVGRICCRCTLTCFWAWTEFWTCIGCCNFQCSLQTTNNAVAPTWRLQDASALVVQHVARWSRVSGTERIKSASVWLPYRQIEALQGQLAEAVEEARRSRQAALLASLEDAAASLERAVREQLSLVASDAEMAAPSGSRGGSGSVPSALLLAR